MIDKSNAIMEGMVSQVLNRKRDAEPKTKAKASVPAEAPRTNGDAPKGWTEAPTPLTTPEGDLRPLQAVPLEVVGSVTATREAILAHLTAMEAEISHIRFTLELLLQPLKVPVTATVTGIEEARKQAEAEADQRAFDRKLKEQAEAAAAATFTAPPITAPEADGWVCPEHGTSKWKTSPKGRQFLVCAQECGEFERAR